MSFLVHISDADRAYLDSLPLSAEAKERVDKFIVDSIANVSDQFRLDPQNRLGPGAPYFHIQYLILDVWGDRKIHGIDFHVNDQAAASGVLLIVFVDHS